MYDILLFLLLCAKILLVKPLVNNPIFVITPAGEIHLPVNSTIRHYEKSGFPITNVFSCLCYSPAFDCCLDVNF